jgi:transposase-like protein
MVRATIRTVFVQPDATSARKTWRTVADSFRSRFRRVAQLLDEAEDEVLVYLSFPHEHRTMRVQWDCSAGSAGASN